MMPIGHAYNPVMPEPPSPTPTDLEAILSNPEYAEHQRMLEEEAAKQPNEPTSFAQNLDYIYERMNRAVSGVVVSNDSYRGRLASAQFMLVVLTVEDFPPELRDTFQSVMKKTFVESDCKALVRDLVGLYLDLSKRVVSGIALGKKYEKETWIVEEAQEGRPEPFIQSLTRQLTDSPRMLADLVRLLRERPARQGTPSIHPARKVAIARMVKDRVDFLERHKKLHKMKVSLNKACQEIARLIEPGKESVEAYYREVYPSAPRRKKRVPQSNHNPLS